MLLWGREVQLEKKGCAVPCCVAPAGRSCLSDGRHSQCCSCSSSSSEATGSPLPFSDREATAAAPLPRHCSSLLLGSHVTCQAVPHGGTISCPSSAPPRHCNSSCWLYCLFLFLLCTVWQLLLASFPGCNVTSAAQRRRRCHAFSWVVHTYTHNQPSRNDMFVTLARCGIHHAPLFPQSQPTCAPPPRPLRRPPYFCMHPHPRPH